MSKVKDLEWVANIANENLTDESREAEDWKREGFLWRTEAPETKEHRQRQRMGAELRFCTKHQPKHCQSQGMGPRKWKEEEHH